MNFLAATLLISASVALFVYGTAWLNAWLDGWEARRDARKRNGAHRW